MNKLILLFLLLCVTLNAFAYDFVKDRLYYTVTSAMVPFTVAVSGGESQSNPVTVPPTVTNGSITYAVTSVRDGAFSSCGWLTNITFPSTLTSIGNSVFMYCNALTSIAIPKNVLSIGSRVFCYCPNLREINVEENNPAFQSINGVLFDANKSTLIAFPNANSTNYIIPDGVSSIAKEAFYNCSGLKSITIPSSVTNIGVYAFSYCSGLSTLSIPASVTSLGDGSFSYCPGLQTLILPGRISTFTSNVFMFSDNIRTIVSGGTNMAKELLTYYSIITSLYILDGTKSIDYSAFSGFTRLRSLYIPSSVEYIGVFAFGLCTSLENIHCQIPAPCKINSNVFFASNVDACKLYVPFGSTSSYRNAATWGDFVNIIEEGTVSINQTKQSNCIVCNDRNSLLIRGSSQGESIFIYNKLGSLVKKVVMESDEMRINLPTNELYLVKTREKMFKVVL